MSHIARFLQAHPECGLVISLPEDKISLLLTAQDRKYITLVRAPDGQLCYTAELLQQAEMWKEKGCLD